MALGLQEQALFAAIESAVIGAIEKWLKGVVDLTALDESGRSFLHAAFVHQADDIPLMLIEAGVPVDRPNPKGFYPLHIAVIRESATLVEAILASNPEMNVDATSSGIRGTTPLHLAVQYNFEGMVSQLLSARADKEAASYYGTPIEIAKRNNDPKMLRLLSPFNSSDIASMAKAGTTHSAESVIFAKAGLSPSAAEVMQMRVYDGFWAGLRSVADRDEAHLQERIADQIALMEEKRLEAQIKRRHLRGVL